MSKYNKDASPNKLLLATGTYMGEDGKPYLYPVIEKVEKMIIEGKFDKSYLPIGGYPQFISGARKLLFGKDISSSDRICTV